MSKRDKQDNDVATRLTRAFVRILSEIGPHIDPKIATELKARWEATLTAFGDDPAKDSTPLRKILDEGSEIQLQILTEKLAKTSEWFRSQIERAKDLAMKSETLTSFEGALTQAVSLANAVTGKPISGRVMDFQLALNNLRAAGDQLKPKLKTLAMQKADVRKAMNLLHGDQSDAPAPVKAPAPVEADDANTIPVFVDQVEAKAAERRAKAAAKKAEKAAAAIKAEDKN